MRVTALALDPIEKKPLARFMPGSMVLSVGSYGCTMQCPWCQNFEIAMAGDTDVPWREMDAKELADHAEAVRPQGNIGLAYTYNEPLLRWQEVLECAREIHARGMKNVVVTNGLAAESRLERLLPWIDAWNIDLKGFTQDVYDLCGGKLETVKRAIALANEHAHVEVTTLLVPGVNDDDEQLMAEFQWLAGLDPVPTLHLSRFFPRYRFSDREPTSRKTMFHAQHLAQRYLPDVLLGNM